MELFFWGGEGTRYVFLATTHRNRSDNPKKLPAMLVRATIYGVDGVEKRKQKNIKMSRQKDIKKPKLDLIGF